MTAAQCSGITGVGTHLHSSVGEHDNLIIIISAFVCPVPLLYDSRTVAEMREHAGVVPRTAMKTNK
jgi:hypothetical protein